MSKNQHTDITNYEFIKDIGEGNFGKVKLGLYKPTGEEFAIKVLNKEKIRKKMKNLALRENEIITKLNHTNIVSVYYIIDTKEDYYIIMEYCKLGELFDYIVKYKRLTEEESSNFFYQLINGVDYIHSMGIAHRDLKPENLLLTEDKVLKIIDFGLSHEFDEDEYLKTKCGSPSYAAPEIISKPNYNGFKIDIWCCGIILYAMLCGYLPFDGDDDSQNNNAKLFQNILKCEPELPDFLSDISKHLIKCILNPDPDKRISLEKIKEHPFYLKGKKLCNVDYNFKEQEALKTRESFHKIFNEDNKNDNYLNIDKNKTENKTQNSNNNYKLNKTDGNIISSNAKNSIDVLTNNKYKFTINIEGRNSDANNHNNLLSIDNANMSKATKNKLQLLSLKTKNMKKNDINSFKKKNNPINLHIQKKQNNKIENILKTETNENANHGLPFIGQRDSETIFSYLLTNKLKFRINNSNNNSLNMIKNSEENATLNNNIKFAPEIVSKINKKFLENKITNNNNDNSKNKLITNNLKNQNNDFAIAFIKKNLENNNNNNININSHKNIKSQGIYKNKMKSSDRMKRNLNLNLNDINNRKINSNMTNTINTYVSGKLTLSLSSENKINLRNKINKSNKYNYEYNYNFNSSPHKFTLVKDSENSSNDIKNNKNINDNFRELKTLIPFGIKHSKKQFINISPKEGNRERYKSSEMKNLKNNQQISNNLGDKLNTKNKDNYKIDFTNEIKFNKLIPKENSDHKLYMLTDSNNPSQSKNTKSKSNPKNYIVNSERSNKRNQVSLQKDSNNSKKYDLTKVVKNAQNGKGIKKNKSFEHNNSINEENSNTKKRNVKLLKLRHVSNDKIKNREDIIKNALFHNNKNYKYFNNLVTLNNKDMLPKLNDHIYNNKNHK